MSSGWTSPTIPPSYNQNPPPDDGTTSAQNTLQWSKHVSKLSGPLVDWINAILAELTSSFANVDATTAAIQPIGAVTAYAAATPPTRWLACDGAAVSRTTYAALFGAIGTTWGAGDGSTTFNVPDLRGTAVIGVGQRTGQTNRALADFVGTETHTLVANEMPTHDHQFQAFIANGGGSFGTTPGSGSGNVVLATGSAGGDQPHNNMQPSLALTYIIYAGA